MTPDTGRQTARSAIRATLWYGAGSFLTLAIALVRSVLLARILAPEQFGILALALVFSWLVHPRNFGFNYALIHRPDPDRSFLSTFNTLNVALGLVALALAAVAAPAMARFYPGEIVPVTVALVGVNLALSAGALPTALLEKDLQFGRVTAINVVAAVAKSVIPVMMALAGAGVWALVAVEAVDAVVRTVMAWALRPGFPGLAVSRQHVRYLWVYGREVFSGNLAAVFCLQFGSFLVGSLASVRALGFYSKAFELSQYPTLVTSGIVSRVTMPVYARVQGDRPALSRAYALVLGGVMRLSAWLGLVLFVGVRELVLLLLGERWLPAVPLVQLLAVYVVLRPIWDDTVSLLAATGRPALLNRLYWLQAIVLAAAGTALTMRSEAMGTAVAVDLMILVGLAAYFARPVRAIVDIMPAQVFVPPLACAAGSIAIVGAFMGGVLPAAPLPRLLLETLVATVLYAALLAVWERSRLVSQWRYLRDIVRSRKPVAPEVAADMAPTVIPGGPAD